MSPPRRAFLQLPTERAVPDDGQVYGAAELVVVAASDRYERIAHRR